MKITTREAVYRVTLGDITVEYVLPTARDLHALHHNGGHGWHGLYRRVEGLRPLTADETQRVFDLIFSGPEDVSPGYDSRSPRGHLS